jgi:hypothetical protein
LNFIALKNLHLQRIWWAVNSTSLLASSQEASYIQTASHSLLLKEILFQQDQKDELVNQHFDSLGPMAMGRYFEQLLFFIIKLDPHYELLAENRQIIEDKITLGELDLILRNAFTGKLEHWEIALKFYLQIENNPAAQHMLGPSTKDNLQRKLIKLMGSQLPLSERKEIKEEFPQLQAKLFVRGIFFYPWQKPFCISEGVNSHHLRGEWLKLSDLSQLKEAGQHWRLKSKPAWIGGQIYFKEEDLLNFEVLQQECARTIQSNGRPQLIALYQKNQNFWSEKEYYFVVPDAWPASNED